MRFSQIVNSPSRTFALVLTVFCFGILIGNFLPLLPILPLLPFLLVFLFFLPPRPSGPSRTFLIFILLASFFFGIFRYQQSEVPSYLITVSDRTTVMVRVQGKVLNEVERKMDGQQIILSNVFVADESVFGKLLVRAPLFPRVSYGDMIIFSCRLEKPEPFNGFSYDKLLESRGILAVCPFPQFVSVYKTAPTSLISVILSFKQFAIQRLQFLFGEPHGSFVSGLIFGGSASLSDDLREDFSRTGLSHILAASGVNVSLFSVVLLHWLLASPLGRRKGLAVSGVLLVFYVIAAGATPAVVRAGIMAGLLILQLAIRRQARMLNVLLLTLAVMLLVNPRLLLDDVGFQLSFVATSALLFIYPSVYKRFSFIPSTLGIRAVVSSSLIAIIFTLPILIWNFGQISLVAPIVNVITLPFVTFLMAVALISLAASILFLPLGQIVAVFGIAISFIILRIVTIFGSLSFASIPIAYSKIVAVAFVIILFLILSHYNAARHTS
ncbi:ComEC/Rec2 family competence protein [Candidatus Uhrbacteria bacterium]|nr:ComEC/Rec2 family competence protein [Candidatus Uhrbacteria bacterium]